MEIVAEYAKSNRSSCKKCSKTIPRGSLRLGLVNRVSKVFDLMQWHHLDCFPRESQPTENIKGFSSLKNSDQEVLNNLGMGGDKNEVRKADEAEVDESEKKCLKESMIQKTDEGGINEFKESDSKKQKVRKADEAKIDGDEKTSLKESMADKRDEDEIGEFKERDSKKQQMCGSDEEAELETVFSVSDVKDKYKDATLLPKWKAFQTIIFLERDDGLQDSNKIAAFDFDGCLVNTSVKRVGPDAWSILYPSVPEKLQSLYNNGYKLVIFTNESNIERWKNKRQQAVDSKLGRLNNFMRHVKVPMQVFVACGLGKTNSKTDDPFRKPKPGMWRIMEQHFNSGIAIDMDQSFYVGDAAGRDKDHGDADIKFAQAVGLKFHLPEEYFGVECVNN
ncbi:phosphoesterase isoform X1 [Tasmannia lanceolata]|uniref:phosphoesterase isoform X1 n=1 Tax=Tasmannia lanceolata TaxID=3420 RepID=UPI004064A20B